LESSGGDGIVTSCTRSELWKQQSGKLLPLIQNLSDDSTLEDIQYHLYVREKVERGLTDLKRRRTVSQRVARTGCGSG